MRGLGSISPGDNILSLDFISRSKASDANIGIIAKFVYFVKKNRMKSLKEILHVFIEIFSNNGKTFAAFSKFQMSGNGQCACYHPQTKFGAR